MIASAYYRKLIEAVGTARVNGVLLAFLGPMLTLPLASPHSDGMLWALFAAILIAASVLFGILVVCVFFLDLLFVQAFNLLEKGAGYGPNVAIRNFEIVSVVAIVSVYGTIYFAAVMGIN